MQQITLSARNLSRSFGPRIAVDDVSLELRRGEVLGLLGANGAGKTTTLQMLAGCLAPATGEIAVCGIDLLGQPRAARAHLGYLPETPPLYREMPVDEYLTYAARLRGVPAGAAAAAVADAKSRCGLSDAGHRLAGALSKGYQQRVGIAQAIVHRPDVVILDEPTVGLDPIQIRDIRALIRELGRDHSVILSSHILPEVETVCDRVQIVSGGRTVYCDTVEALQKERTTSSLRVGLRNPPPAGELAGIPGVDRVEALAPGSFRIVPKPGADPAGEIARLAVAGGWEMTELTPVRATLEEVFVALSGAGNGAAGAKEAQ